MNSNIKPVPGAARYFAGSSNGKFYVFMEDTDKFVSDVQPCKSMDAAWVAAEKWQAKENKAVLRADGPEGKQ